MQHLCDKCLCPDKPELSLYIRVSIVCAHSRHPCISSSVPCMTVEISRRWSLLDCVWWPGITAHQLVEQMLPCIRSTAQYPAVSFNLSVFSFFKAILDIYIYIYLYIYLSIFRDIYI